MEKDHQCNDSISGHYGKRRHIRTKQAIYIYCVGPVGSDHYAVYAVDVHGDKLHDQGKLLMDIKSLSRFTLFNNFRDAELGPFKSDWKSSDEV